MTFTSRRILRVAAPTIVIVVVIGAIPAGGIARPTDRSRHPYCKTVRDMITYTQQETQDLNNRLDNTGSNESDWPDLVWYNEMHAWAHEMGNKASRVNQQHAPPEVGQQTQALAEYSGSIVAKILPQIYAQTPVSVENPAPDENPPEWMQSYNNYAAEIDLNIDLLNADCPA